MVQVTRQITFNLCLLQLSVHYFQLFVMCNNYHRENDCDITIVVIRVVDLAIAFDIRNLSKLQ